jgi:3-oxoacyl-[acyl-carrier protein] reductase
MSYSLRGKHCIVTGATGSIGFRIAAAFAEQGSVVSLVSRSAPDARAKLEPQLVPYKPDPDTYDPEDPPPSAHRFLHLDGTRPVAFQGFFGATAGRADILVNCAGISQTSFLRRTYDSDITKILETNLRATILACKYARLKPNGMYNTAYLQPQYLTLILQGCIINISSLMANKDGAGASVYAASKAGVVGTFIISLRIYTT